MTPSNVDRVLREHNFSLTWNNGPAVKGKHDGEVPGDELMGMLTENKAAIVEWFAAGCPRPCEVCGTAFSGEWPTVEELAVAGQSEMRCVGGSGCPFAQPFGVVRYEHGISRIPLGDE